MMYRADTQFHFPSSNWLRRRLWWILGGKFTESAPSGTTRKRGWSFPGSNYTYTPSFIFIQTQNHPTTLGQQIPVTNLPLHTAISEKIDNLHNSFKCKNKSILLKEHKFLPKSKLSSNLPFRKSKYPPNNLPDFTSGCKLNSDNDSLLYHSPSKLILDRWCLDVQNSVRVSK